VKVHHPAAQLDIQWITSDNKLDDVRIFLLVFDCFPAKWVARHYHVRLVTKITQSFQRKALFGVDRKLPYLPDSNPGSLAIFTARSCRLFARRTARRRLLTTAKNT
jgi:hypothetical protein